MPAPKMLIIMYSDHFKEPRVLRQVRWLKEDFKISTAGFSAAGIDGVGFFPIVKRGNTKLDKVKYGLALLFKRFEAYYWGALGFGGLVDEVKGESFDVIIAHDYDALPAAARIAANAPAGKTTRIIFDAHEYSPRQFENNLIWSLTKRPLIMWALRKYLPMTDERVTVCSGLAAEYEKEFGLKFEVVTNASPYFDLKPKPVADDRVRMIHHGVLNKTRKIEAFIDAMDFLDGRFSLDLVLMNAADKAHLEKIERMAARDPRIRILPPVRFNDIVPFLSGYDVGLCSFPATTFNLQHTLPNKFFEFVQSRLALVISPVAEMHSLMAAWGFGVVARAHTGKAIADAIKTLDTATINAMKAASDTAAKELCAEANGVTFREIAKRCAP